MQTKETICAVATPPGHGAIAIVRISGEQSVEIADRVFRSSGGCMLAQVPTHTIHHGYLLNPFTQEKIDEALATVMRAPKSYTREDTIELGVHGGPFVIMQVLEILTQAGARPAKPGEFTFRAYLNGRLDLTQAEAVMEMITSRTEEGRRIAMAHLQGVLSRTIRPLYQRLIDLLAHLEASIDFCEQGIQVYTEQELVQEMEILLSRSVALLETYRAGRIRREGANTVLAGRPNVGKSSLLNALLGEDRAIVTPFPGTTRDILQEYLPLEGITLRLSDMAGLRPTPEPIEQEGVRRAEAILEGADLILLVLDGSVPLQEQDRLLIRKLSGKRVLIVLNKSDLPIRLSEEEVKTVAPNLPLVVLSALTGSGIGELKKSIWRALSEDVSALEEGVLTQARHAHALERGRIALERALETARRGFSWEFVASDLQIARKNLGEILGEEVSDEVIEAIFKRFCIGK